MTKKARWQTTIRVAGVWLMIAVGTPAADYFVSPGGDDAQAGTRVAPWQSAEKAGAAAQAGDTVTFLTGEYGGALAPTNSGAEGRPIVFRSEPALAARFVGGNPAIDLTGRGHIVLDGLRVEPTNGGLLKAVDGAHLTIRNCVLDGSRRNWNGVDVRGCRYVTFRDNLIQRHLALGGEHGQYKMVFWGHMFGIEKSRYVRIEGNRIGKGGHASLVVGGCEDAIIRRNLLFAGWGRAMGLNCKRMLFEENVIVGAVDSGGSANPSSPFPGAETIVRHNLIVRNFGEPIAHGFYMAGKKGSRVSGRVLHNRFYHNTLSCNLEGGWGATSFIDPATVGAFFDDNIWRNNLFHQNDFAGDFTAIRLADVPPGYRFIRNLICGDGPGRKTIDYHDRDKPEDSGRYTLAEAEARFPDRFARNLDVDPALANPGADDYRLRAGSPAIDAGEFLARTLADGAGRRLALDDTRGFHDGFGIPGEPGDLVFVGAGKTAARVTAVDHEQNVLTLDRDLAWRAGDPVHIPYAGARPDLGAMEFGAETETWYRRLVVPAGSYFKPPPDALLTSDFEDATVEEWGHMWNVERRYKTISDRDDSTAASGRYSIKVRALAAGASLSLDTPAHLWELDAYPYVSFAYRVPPGVAVGLWLRPFELVKRPLPAHACIGGSPAMASLAPAGAGSCKLIDDDCWHTLTVDARVIRKAYPGIKYLRAFEFGNAPGMHTRGHAREGDAFWFDDFSIGSRPRTP
ncbi:MAG: right-handed parallel beta-helix repeat-containing protein [Kiritimatiellae bacterium]|nr:right-handed parallel beta-helix repeat-containing protein [Kiritimatiellia bacterium]